jgi:FkbM family methyltransferase
LEWGAYFWLIWNKWALESCIQVPHIIVTFDQLLADPVQTMIQIGRQLDFPYPIKPQNAADAILNFIQPSQKHWHASSASLSDRTFFHPYTQIFNFFKKCASRPKNVRMVEPLSGFSSTIECENVIDFQHTPEKAFFEQELLRLLQRKSLEISKEPLSKIVDKFSKKSVPLEKPVPENPVAKATLIIPDKAQKSSKYTKIFQGMEWQTINFRLYRTDSLKHVAFRLQPMDKPGVVRIRSIKMLNMTTGMPWWEMGSSKDFEAVQAHDMAITLPDKDDLLLMISGPGAEIAWDCRDAYVDYPTSIEIQIKVESDIDLTTLEVTDLADMLNGLLGKGRFIDALYIIDHCPGVDFSSAQNPQLMAWLIRLLLDSNRLFEAVACYEQAMIAKMEIPIPPLEIGNKLESGEFWKEAEKFYRQVVHFVPKHISALTARIRILKKLNRTDEADRVTAEALEKFKHSHWLHIDIGQGLFFKNARRSALAHFLEAQKHGADFPLWGNRAISALSRETVDLHSVKLRVPTDIVSPLVLQAIIKGNYEQDERRLAKYIIHPGDRVLELGGGIGYIACSILINVKNVEVCTVEANPALIPLIKKNLRLNNVQATVLQGLASDKEGQADFHVSENFWASSVVDIPMETSLMKLPAIDTNQLIAKFKPNKMIIDIEGGEVDLLPKLRLDAIEAIAIEVHQRFTGIKGVSKVFKTLLDQGFEIDLEESGGHVYVFKK